MNDSARPPHYRAEQLHFHLLGMVDYLRMDALQRHIAEEMELSAVDRQTSAGGQAVVLLCEHPRLITVGRRGSRAHVRLGAEQLAHKRLETRWIARGGGCVLHGPGQLAVYVVASLEGIQASTSSLLGQLQAALESLFVEARLQVSLVPGEHGVWGRTGRLLTMGATRRDATAFVSLYLNVNPDMADYARIDTVSPSKLPAGLKSTMSCLLAESGRPVKMSQVRSDVVRHLATAFQCEHYHLQTGHRLLSRMRN